MTVKENLIAAKALIDTPEKWEKIGKSQSAAIYNVTQTWEDYEAARAAYDAIRLRGIGYENVIATFNRAITAQDASP